MNNISFPLAFFAGILSFFSPSSLGQSLQIILSLLPLIVGQVFFRQDLSGNITLTKRRAIKLILTNTLLFLLGFLSVFTALGVSSIPIGQLLFANKSWITFACGLFVIIFGFLVAGYRKLDSLTKNKKIYMSGRYIAHILSFIIGMALAVIWTPTIGPILSNILLYAASKDSMIYGLTLLVVYSLGLAISLFIFVTIIALCVPFSLNSLLNYSRRLHFFTMLISGLLLVIFGIMLLTYKEANPITTILSTLSVAIFCTFVAILQIYWFYWYYKINKTLLNHSEGKLIFSPLIALLSQFVPIANFVSNYNTAKRIQTIKNICKDPVSIRPRAALLFSIFLPFGIYTYILQSGLAEHQQHHVNIGDIRNE